MDTFWSIYGFLWENEVVIAIFLVFILWFFVRFFDLSKWMYRKFRKNKDKSLIEEGSQSPGTKA